MILCRLVTSNGGRIYGTTWRISVNLLASNALPGKRKPLLKCNTITGVPKIFIYLFYVKCLQSRLEAIFQLGHHSIELDHLEM